MPTRADLEFMAPGVELKAASLDEIDIVGAIAVRCGNATVRSRDARFICFNLMTAVAVLIFKYPEKQSRSDSRVA